MTEPPQWHLPKDSEQKSPVLLVATVLLEAGADTAAQDKNGLNPLSVAKKAKHDAVVTLLDGAENMAA